jgi:hypothetical protein
VKSAASPSQRYGTIVADPPWPYRSDTTGSFVIPKPLKDVGQRGVEEMGYHSMPLRATEGLPTAYLWPREGAHSVKPDAFYDLVEHASPGPYLEMFSRRARLGWDTYGDEALHGTELIA